MTKRSSQKAFSVVELVIAMGIIAILIALAVYGLGVLQKKSRDSERVAALNEIKSQITRFQSVNGRLPRENVDMLWETEQVTFVYPGGKIETVRLSGAARLKSFNSTTAESDTRGTVYYYEIKPDGFVLGADKEQGVQDAGTSKTKYEDLR